jgi:hypothetical protein
MNIVQRYYILGRMECNKMAVALYRTYCNLEFVISATTFSERVL